MAAARFGKRSNAIEANRSLALSTACRCSLIGSNDTAAQHVCYGPRADATPVDGHRGKGPARVHICFMVPFRSLAGQRRYFARDRAYPCSKHSLTSKGIQGDAKTDIGVGPVPCPVEFVCGSVAFVVVIVCCKIGERITSHPWAMLGVIEPCLCRCG